MTTIVPRTPRSIVRVNPQTNQVIVRSGGPQGPAGTGGGGGGGNTFSTVAVSGQSDVVADSTSDTLTLAAGTAVGITTNATTDTVTIAVTDAELAALAGLTSAADKVPYFTGSGTAALADLTAAGRALIDDADATAQRTTLGLGTLATQSGTFSGTHSGASSGTNTGDQSVFTTIAVSGQSNVVADSTSDTLTIVAGSNVTITTDASTDTITIAASGGGGGGNTFSTVAVSGQSDVVADSTSDTLTLAAGTAVGITTNATTDTVTIAVTDAELAALAGLTSAADKVPYFTGSGTAALADLSSAMRTFFTTPSSANLAALVSDETGTGALVFATNPGLTLPSVTETGIKFLDAAQNFYLTAKAGAISANRTLIVTCDGNHTLTLTGSATLSGTNLGSTKTYCRFAAHDSFPPASNYATRDTRNSVPVLDFDDTTEESAYFIGVIPENASLGSGLKVTLHFMATSATSGNARWGVAFEATGTDLDADSFDTATEGTVAISGTSGIETTITLTCTTIDSVAAQGRFRLKVYRDVTDAADTVSGDLELVSVEVWSAA